MTCFCSYRTNGTDSKGFISKNQFFKMKAGPYNILITSILALVGIIFILMGLNGILFSYFFGTILMVCGIVLVGISVSRIKRFFPSPKQLEEEKEIRKSLEGSWHCKNCKAFNLKDDRVCYSCGNPFKNIKL